MNFKQNFIISGNKVTSVSKPCLSFGMLRESMLNLNVGWHDHIHELSLHVYQDFSHQYPFKYTRHMAHGRRNGLSHTLRGCEFLIIPPVFLSSWIGWLNACTALNLLRNASTGFSYTSACRFIIPGHIQPRVFVCCVCMVFSFLRVLSSSSVGGIAEIFLLSFQFLISFLDNKYLFILLICWKYWHILLSSILFRYSNHQNILLLHDIHYLLLSPLLFVYK